MALCGNTIAEVRLAKAQRVSLQVAHAMRPSAGATDWAYQHVILTDEGAVDAPYRATPVWTPSGNLVASFATTLMTNFVHEAEGKSWAIGIDAQTGQVWTAFKSDITRNEWVVYAANGGQPYLAKKIAEKQSKGYAQDTVISGRTLLTF